jgi:membrane associated rhomboid family serine protease
MFLSLRVRIITIMILFFISSQSAYAYLDPGTGSYIFQLVLAGLIGGLFAVKLFWKKIKNFLGNLIARKKD